MPPLVRWRGHSSHSLARKRASKEMYLRRQERACSRACRDCHCNQRVEEPALTDDSELVIMLWRINSSVRMRYVQYGCVCVCVCVCVFVCCVCARISTAVRSTLHCTT